MRNYLLGLGCVLAVALSAAPASAHVVMTDETSAVSATLHIHPDDDPIAGEPSQLYFGLRHQSPDITFSGAKLEIIDQQGVATAVPVTMREASVSASYTFPRQGAYTIKLVVNAEAGAETTPYTLTHAQRISRGVGSESLDAPSHGWADLLLVVSIAGLFGLFVSGYHRRAELANYGRWAYK